MNTATRSEYGAMTMRYLEGQRALVTGANSGIGEAIARGLAEAGAGVVIDYVANGERAHGIVAEIVKTGGKAIVIQADASQEGEVKGMFEEMFDVFGGIDILVNNAGLQRVRLCTR